MALKRLIDQKKLQLARKIRIDKKRVQVLEGIQAGMGRLEVELELFDLWDSENHGYLSFRQLADSIATCPDLNSAVSFEDLIRFAKLDPKLADQPLDRAQFGHLLESLVERAGGAFEDWAQLLALEYSIPDVPAYYDQAPEPVAAAGKQQPGEDDTESVAEAVARDGRMHNLFALFDMDLDGSVSFKDVALGLRKIAPHITIERASEAALRVLLNFDLNHDRVLDYVEFTHFICAFLHTGNLQFAQVADALVLAAARPDPSEEELARFDSLLKSSGFQNFTDRRMHEIFDLLDKDKDGYISFKELCLGLHKFEPSKPLAQSVEHTAGLLERMHLPDGGSDPEAQLTLQRSEFCQVLTKFVEESGADFDQVADYLVAVSSTAVDDVQASLMPGWFFNRVAPEKVAAMAESQAANEATEMNVDENPL